MTNVNEFESNSIVRGRVDNTHASVPIPVDPLIVLDGKLNGVKVRVLQDDGCNTNVVSKRLVKKFRHCFKVVDDDVLVQHSDKDSNERSSQVVLNGTLKIGNHTYTSNWVVANSRYDVLLGMPWHVAHNPTIQYDTGVVKVGDVSLNPYQCEECDDSGPVKITNLGVRKFRLMIKKASGYFEVFQLVRKNNVQGLSQGSCKTDKRLQELLKKYEDLFKDDLPSGLPPGRNVDHEIIIEEEGKPPHRPLFQLSPEELKAAKEYVDSLLKKKKIIPSRSPYGAPLFFVKEKNGRMRGVVDYRALNRITKRNNTPLPRSDEMFDRIGEAKFFSKMDLKTGFHQIRMRPEDIEKTAFNTKYGQYEYLVMPMGLCNAPATFQTLMNNIFHDCLDEFMVVYMDDLLIFSKDKESHYKHLEIVLSRLKEHELYVAPKKCEFFEENIDFLGLLIGKDGLQVNPEKVEILKTWPKPASVTDIRSFLGLLQFFRRFIPDFAKIASPLTDLTKKGSGVHKWNEECDKSFQKLKDAITTAPVLVAPDWSKPFRGHIDASERAVGGTLTQLDENGKDRVISFFSKKLSPEEVNYTANDRELLGLIRFLQRFRCYLEGWDFEIFTDNQVLKHFFSKKDLSRREARWVETLGNFGIFPITLKPGKIHVLGDTLSRAPHAKGDASLNDVEVPFIRFEDVIVGYEDDQFFGPIVKALTGEWPTEAKQKVKLEKLVPMFTMEGKKLLYRKKLCVPRKSISTVMHMAHDSKISGHFKFAKTMARLDNFHWRHKARDVKKYIDGCIVCQQYKDSNQKKLSEPVSLEMPERRWGSLATDFIVHLPKTKNGYDSITTWVDRLSRRVHFVKSKTTDTSIEVSDTFFSNIFKHHGMPDSIVSDRDSKFTSEFWKRLMELCGVQLKMSSSRHPQTDGASEIMNRMVENYLRCYCSYHQDDWDELLPAAEFAYNSAVSEDLGMSPFEMDIGWNPKSALDFMTGYESSVESVDDLKKNLRESLNDAQYSYGIAKAKQSAESSQKYKAPSYVIGSKVWINKSLYKDAYSKSQQSDKLSSRRVGPFIVKELIGKNAVRLELPEHFKIHPVVHVSHTMPFVEQPSEIAQHVQPRPEPIPTVEGKEYTVDKILNHRKRGRGYQFLTLMKGEPHHDAKWQPTSDFVDKDGTVTDVWLEYIRKHDILPMFQE